MIIYYYLIIIIIYYYYYIYIYMYSTDSKLKLNGQYNVQTFCSLPRKNTKSRGGTQRKS